MSEPSKQQDVEINRLMDEARKENGRFDYWRQLLCKVPIEVIWNEFSNSNVKLDVPEA